MSHIPGINVVKVEKTADTVVVFSELYMVKDPETGVMSVSVVFRQTDLISKEVQILKYSRSLDDFNTFWTGFKNGKYLYTQLALKNEAGTLIPIPASIELDFTNQQI